MLIGRPLHVAYEDAKSALQQNKSTQRQITAVLNNLKCFIDELQGQKRSIERELDDGEENEEDEDEGEGEGEKEKKVKKVKIKIEKKDEHNREKEAAREEREERVRATASLADIDSRLTGAKKDYRLASKELELCKRQVSLRSQLKSKFFDFLDENRLIFVVLCGRFQRLERDIVVLF